MILPLIRANLENVKSLGRFLAKMSFYSGCAADLQHIYTNIKKQEHMNKVNIIRTSHSPENV